MGKITMVDPILGRAIVEQLSHDIRLKEMWFQLPTVTPIPVSDRRDRFFLLINLSLATQHGASDEVVYATLSTAHRIISAHLCAQHSGLEVAAYVWNGYRFD